MEIDAGSVVIADHREKISVFRFVQAPIDSGSSFCCSLLISRYSVPFYLGGTSLLIVVTVTMDLVAQVHSHLIAHQYEGLIKKAKLRGRI